jgi:hypothetical protein
MIATARLIFKQLRFEAIAIIVVSLVLILVLLGESWRLLALDLPACSGAGAPVDCAARQADFDGQFSLVFVLELAAALATVFGGLVLGVAVVGRELERGTTALAWPLARSRWRWLVTRWLVIGVGLLVLSFAVGVATEPLSGAMRSAGRASSFDGAEVRAPVLALRAVTAFTLAVLIGAILGRTLPALLIGFFVMPLLVLGIDQGMNAWLRSVSQPIDVNAVNQARIVDTQWRERATGRVISRFEYLQLTPPPSAPPDWDTVAFDPIPIGVPDSRVGEYLAVECLQLAGTTIVLLVAGAAVVERRAAR